MGIIFYESYLKHRGPTFHNRLDVDIDICNQKSMLPLRQRGLCLILLQQIDIHYGKRVNLLGRNYRIKGFLFQSVNDCLEYIDL